MHNHKIDKKALDVAADALMKSRHITPNGEYVLRCNISNLFIEDISSLLLSAYRFKSDVCPLDRKRIITKAKFAFLKSKHPTGEALQQCIKNSERQFRATRKSTFEIVTHLSVDAGLTSSWISRRQYNASRFHFGLSVPAHYDITSLTPKLRYRNLERSPPNWRSIVIRTDGRTPQEALWRGANDLNILRAIWNFKRNLPLMRRWGDHAAINRFRAGPIMTAHLPDGSLASEYYYFDSDLIGDCRRISTLSMRSDELGKLIRFEHGVRRQLKRIPYSTDIQDILLDYVIALDDSNYSATFLRLWAILEMLVCSRFERRADYDALIARTSFIYEDREIARLLLEHLREVRNRLAHEGVAHEEMAACVGQLLQFVHALLLFHLRMAGQFNHLEEVRDFLELPHSKERLLRRIRLSRMAMRFHDLGSNR